MKPAGARPFRWLIEYLEDSARAAGAEQRPLTVAEIDAAFFERWPAIAEREKRQRVVGTIQFHCINIRARFPFPAIPTRPARWMTRPLFKLVGRKGYQLLSEAEKADFFRRLTACDSLLFRDDYHADELKVD